MKFAISVSLAALALASCAANPPIAAVNPGGTDAPPPSAVNSGPATVEQAREFVARAEKELSELGVIQARADWVNATYITEDTDALAAHFGTQNTELRVRLANEAARFANVAGLDYDTTRKLNLLRSALTLPAPTTAGAAAELNTINT